MLEFLFESSIALTLYFQSLGEGLLTAFEIVSELGTEDFYFLVMPIIFWSIDAALGMRVGFLLVFGATVNTFLKWAFHLPRPYWIDARVRGWVAEPSFGAPSGHAQFNLSIYGLIAVTLRRRWAWVLATALVALISFSRVVLGVHFYVDILLGWLFGLLALWIFLRLEEPVQQWLGRRSLLQNTGILLGLSWVIILAGAWLLGVQENKAIPAEWVANAVANHPDVPFGPLDLSSLITTAASFFGLATGALWLWGRGGFNAGGTIWQRGLRFVIGLLGVLVLWQGLGAVFPGDADLVSYTLRFVRYALVGLWIMGGAPWLFMRIGLAKATS